MFDREGKFEKTKRPKKTEKAQKTKEGLVKYYKTQPQTSTWLLLSSFSRNNLRERTVYLENLEVFCLTFKNTCQG